ncbi:ClpXP protease specificity-enhancing factor SspB [Vitiosangium sp. GDMCC 1.1324]|uniref:ClpXP protease specificity-enhancing factor SspB n=1 Tax=Vitiosangium sp. (strain GDMCC 1.1324) TaxID=2138576 RepID=UPI000D3DBC85|nr:ClpXP protease specificity-enhancing factor SspB [Vitiosangium sp. GDMCC 1.1324]PTL77883.1 stringent starvation protein B [Vitiosangium sp. GDMCC 1.1324]
MDKKGPEKKARLLAALDKGMVMIHLDARRPGVIVPPALRTESHLRLNLSYRFDPPDLTVGEWGVRCTLSFSGSRFTVAVPWSALFAITSHVTKEFWMYPDDMPAELIQQTMVTTKAPMPEPVAEQPAAPVERPRAVLREVARQEPEESAEPPVAPVEAEGPKDDPPTPRRGHLRLVK